MNDSMIDLIWIGKVVYDSGFHFSMLNIAVCFALVVTKS